MPPKRREVNEPFCHAHFKLLKCTHPNCQVTLKEIQTLKDTSKIVKLAKRGKWTKTHYCKAKFSQKYNLERHVKNVHQEDGQVYEGYDEEVIENAPEETMERTSQESLTFHMSSWMNEEILNA